MRSLLFASAVAAGLTLAPSIVQAAQSCPSDVLEAGRAVWPRGSIRSGKSVTGTHPCGRRLMCTGGVGSTSGTRQCRWL
jgi:hypothetical protein